MIVGGHAACHCIDRIMQWNHAREAGPRNVPAQNSCCPEGRAPAAVSNRRQVAHIWSRLQARQALMNLKLSNVLTAVLSHAVQLHEREGFDGTGWRWGGHHLIVGCPAEEEGVPASQGGGVARPEHGPQHQPRHTIHNPHRLYRPRGHTSFCAPPDRLCSKTVHLGHSGIWTWHTRALE